MNINFRMIVFWLTIAFCTSHCTAFWWSRSEPVQPEPHNQWPQMPGHHVYYQQRLLKTQPHNYPEQTQGIPQVLPPPASQSSPQMSSIPAIPIQLPLQAQLAHMPNIHNVQLVPCLCPIGLEEFEKPIEVVQNPNVNKNNV